MEHFARIDTWIFDLDNTLYPSNCNLFSQIDVLMTRYVSRLTDLEPIAARKLQKNLYRDYGTTLSGLMKTRNIDPHDFLATVHNIDYSSLPQKPHLGEMLKQLPGRKLIYTNGSVNHARNTLAAMKINHDLFEGIFDIIASEFEPKPHDRPFVKFLQNHDVTGKNSAMFEDLPRNLEPAKNNGMITILVQPDNSGTYSVEPWERQGANKAHIDYHTNDLDGFLSNVLKYV